MEKGLGGSVGQGVGSLTVFLLGWFKRGERSERLITTVPNSLFSAGCDMTYSTMQALIFVLVTHLHAQKVAQEEIDQIMGEQRGSQTFEDLPNLPYLPAVIIEFLHWRLFLPLCLAHATASTDTYKIYQIPAKTTVLANAYALNNNEGYYPSPPLFSPKRHLNLSDPRFRPEFQISWKMGTQHIWLWQKRLYGG